MQDVPVQAVQGRPGTVTKLIPATARGTDAIAQPPQRTVLLGVLKPLAGLPLPPSQFKQYNCQHQIWPMGYLATAGIGVIELRQIEVGHGLANLPSQMIMGELDIDLTPRAGL